MRKTATATTTAMLAAAALLAAATPTTAQNYTAIPYEPVPGLKSLHESARLYGVNSLDVSGGFSFTGVNSFMEGPLGRYFIGVLAPAIVMILIAVIWLISLCCTRCCCKGGCGGKNVALTIFTIACAMSFAGWILGIIASSMAVTGLMNMVNGVQGVTNIMSDVRRTGADAVNITDALLVRTNDMSSTCATTTTTFPAASLSQSLNDVKSQINNSLLPQIATYDDKIRSYFDLVRAYIQWVNPVLLSFMSVMAAMTALFFFGTAFRVMERTPERCHAVATCTSKFSAVFVFCFAILLMVLLWIIVAIVHVLITLGADVCYPSINTNLNRIIAQAAGGSLGSISGNGNGNGNGNNNNGRLLLALDEADTEAVTVAAADAAARLVHVADAAANFWDPSRRQLAYNGTGDPCVEDPSFATGVGSILCYYQRCTGRNEIAELTNPVRSATSTTTNTLNNFVQDVQAQGGVYADPARCVSSIAAFTNETTNVNGFVGRTLDYASCAYINPIYANLMYGGFCNGLIGGMYFLYVSVIMALSSLMLAMSVYLVFDFGAYRDGHKPDEWADENNGGQYDANAPPAGKGGPIVAAEAYKGDP